MAAIVREREREEGGGGGSSLLADDLNAAAAFAPSFSLCHIGKQLCVPERGKETEEEEK